MKGYLLLSRMYDIVVGIDQSEERARRQAETVAGLPGAEDVHAILVHVFTDNPEGATVGQIAAVRTAQEQLEQAGIETTLAGESGDPVERLLDVADDRDTDAIVVGGRKRSPTGKVLFGSTTQAVLLETDLPVLIAGNKDVA